MLSVKLEDLSDEDKTKTVMTIIKDNWKVQTYTSDYPVEFMNRLVKFIENAYQGSKVELTDLPGISKKHKEKHLAYFNHLIQQAHESCLCDKK